MIDSSALWAFVTIFSATFGALVIGAYFQRRKLISRLERAVLDKRDSQPEDQGVGGQLIAVWRTNYFLNSAKAFSERIDVLKGDDPEALSMVLATAGYAGREPVVIYAFAKLTGFILGTIITLGVMTNTLLVGRPVLIPLALSLGAALFILRLPDLFLAAKRRQRQSVIRRNFPQMVELMIIASESGLAPSPAMLRSADELSKSCPALASELRQLVSELSVLPDRSEAYKRFSSRIDLAEATHFGTALLQGETFGTSFSATLRTMAKELRTMRMTKIEERATRLPVLMTVPLIAFIMPALFVVILGPAALSIVDNLANVEAEE